MSLLSNTHQPILWHHLGRVELGLPRGQHVWPAGVSLPKLWEVGEWVRREATFWGKAVPGLFQTLRQCHFMSFIYQWGSDFRQHEASPGDRVNMHIPTLTPRDSGPKHM